MIILICGQKGGTGKTTVAINLAVELSKKPSTTVVLVDADKQQNATQWCELRDMMKIDCVQLYGLIHNDLTKLHEQYTHVIVDASGKDSVETRSAAFVADSMIVPIKTSQNDINTLDIIETIFNDVKKQNKRLTAHVLLNMVSPHPKSKEAIEISELITTDYDLDVLKSTIKERKIYKTILTDGTGVTETSDVKSSDEIKKLTRELLKKMGNVIRRKKTVSDDVVKKYAKKADKNLLDSKNSARNFKKIGIGFNEYEFDLLTKIAKKLNVSKLQIMRDAIVEYYEKY